jgi:hypothetical protein
MSVPPIGEFTDTGGIGNTTVMTMIRSTTAQS